MKQTVYRQTLRELFVRFNHKIDITVKVYVEKQQFWSKHYKIFLCFEFVIINTKFDRAQK